MQNIKFIITSFLIASGISFFACTERMDINVNDAPRQLAIYGSITTDTMQHAISVMRSSNYFSNSAPEGISGAAVTISNGDEVFTLTESPSEKGVYLTASDVFGTEGNTYTLKVVVDFNGVTDEYTATSLLPRAVQVDSFKLQPSNISNNINALLYGKFPEIGNNYMNILAYKNNHIPLNDKLSDFNIIVSENRDSREIDGAACMRFRTKYDEDRAYIEKGDLITIQVCSITKEYADYVQNVQKELIGSLPIFSGPPANIQTNIHARNTSEKAPVCGFFTAYSKRSGQVLWE